MKMKAIGSQHTSSVTLLMMMMFVLLISILLLFLSNFVQSFIRWAGEQKCNEIFILGMLTTLENHVSRGGLNKSILELARGFMLDMVRLKDLK